MELENSAEIRSLVYSKEAEQFGVAGAWNLR